MLPIIEIALFMCYNTSTYDERIRQMIRLAKESDISTLLKIYDAAKKYMHENGNPTQWTGKYPDEETLTDDIKKNQLFVAEESGLIYGCFALIEGEDPTYGYIDGEWKSNAPYGTIHRIASSRIKKGLFDECVNFARTRYNHLRVDTHEDNKPMQSVALKNGFEYVGIIYLADGSPRRAYEWLK